MAKRRNKASDERRKKAKTDADAQLATGVFGGDVDSDEAVPDWENEEQTYELKPRAVKKQVEEGLPIKRMDGRIERTQREKALPEEHDEEPAKVEPEQPNTVPEEEEEEFVDSKLSPRERLVKLKEEIAGLASSLIEDPEENISCLTRLRKMSMSKNIVVSQLSIMALIPVFKALAPGYRIRALTVAEKREKVSRDVARLRAFEQSLIYNYKQFLDHLGRLAKVSRANSENNKKITEDQITLGQLSIKACCEMCLSSLKSFNYRDDLFTIVIRRLNRKPKNADDHAIFEKCIRVLESLLKDDKEHGELSFDIMKILTKSINDKNFRVDESVINIFLSLSVLNDFNANKETKGDTREKIRKKDRVHLTKKQKKARKEVWEIEKELSSAAQTVTAEEREKYQSKILQMLLKLYLEILRAGSQSINMSESKQSDAAMLIAPVLEGLSRFGKMANFDLLGDFLEVLREVMFEIIDNHSLENEDDDDDGSGLFEGIHIRTVLLCIVTSFSLTITHMSVGRLPMSIDLSKFISALYVVLSDISLDFDLEFSHKSLRLLDPLSESDQLEKPSVNVSTKSELLLNALDSVFFRSRNGSVPRAVSFTKRLYVAMLQTPEKTSLALLKFAGKLVGRHGEALKGLWNTEERISGEGNYVLGIERANKEVELQRSNAEAATLWETVLLDKHYSPMVRDGARSLLKNSKVGERR